MTNMPVLDKNSAVQNVLSTKAARPAASSKGSFDSVLQQTTAAGKQNTAAEDKAESVKTSEPKAQTEDTPKTQAEDTASETQVEESGKAEENAGTNEMDAQAKDVQDVSEDIAEDTEVLERAGGEMVAALAAQMEIPQEAIRETMEELGMTDVS